MGNQPYRLPGDDEEDALLKAAIERAELERTPAFRTRADTIAFFRTHATNQCPFKEQDYGNLGGAPPKTCTGGLRLRRLPSGTWFLGCTEYRSERGHRFVRVPPSVDKELLGQLIEDPDAARTHTDQPPTCLYMQPRWARSTTCPLETTNDIHLMPAGTHDDGTCDVRLTAYTFERESIKPYTIILLTGTHTHPRGIRALPKGALRSRLFQVLDREPHTTLAQLAATIRTEMSLEPSSSALKHAYADWKLEHNPLGEDQVAVMAQQAAEIGRTPYIRKCVFGARGGHSHNKPYSYVIFYLDEMMDIAVLQSCFCADLSFKDFNPLERPSDAEGEWHLFSVTAWCARLARTVTIFKAATIGECEEMYQDLFEELLREGGLRGQRMPSVGSAVTGRKQGEQRERELLSVTLDFCPAQAVGAARALAKKAGLDSLLDAARAFLRGCHVHY